MIDTEIKFALLKIDGLEPTGIEGWPYRYIDTKTVAGLDTDYLKNHDACHRLIVGMDDDQLFGYYCNLSTIFGKVDDSWVDADFIPVLCKATPRQKCEAILKALGKWED